MKPIYHLIVCMICVAKEYAEKELTLNFIVDHESELQLKKQGYNVSLPEMRQDESGKRYIGPFTTIRWNLS